MLREDLLALIMQLLRKVQLMEQVNTISLNRPI